MNPKLDIRDYRSALGCFVTGVSVVTTRGGAGLATGDGSLGITVNSFTSVSLDPPLVSFALDRKGGRAQPFIENAHFCINVLAEDQVELSKVFAAPGHTACDAVSHGIGPAGSPVFSGVLAAFHCRLETTMDGGDHIILLGHVRDYVYDPSRQPLVYFRGDYAGVL